MSLKHAAERWVETRSVPVLIGVILSGWVWSIGKWAWWYLLIWAVAVKVKGVFLP